MAAQSGLDADTHAAAVMRRRKRHRLPTARSTAWEPGGLLIGDCTPEKLGSVCGYALAADFPWYLFSLSELFPGYLGTYFDVLIGPSGTYRVAGFFPKFNAPPKTAFFPAKTASLSDPDQQNKQSRNKSPRCLHLQSHLFASPIFLAITSTSSPGISLSRASSAACFQPSVQAHFDPSCL